MKPNRFPAGWDEDRVQDILAHYKSQSEDEAVAEDEAAFAAPDQTVMDIPTELVPAVRELIAKHNPACRNLLDSHEGRSATPSQGPEGSESL